MTKAEAIAAMEANEVEEQRICSPGQWVVWRDGEMIFSKDLS